MSETPDFKKGYRAGFKAGNAQVRQACQAIAKAKLETRALRLKKAKLRNMLSLMLDVAENADETGYVTDVGFVNLDKLHAEVRAAIKS